LNAIKGPLFSTKHQDHFQAFPDKVGARHAALARCIVDALFLFGRDKENDLASRVRPLMTAPDYSRVVHHSMFTPNEFSKNALGLLSCRGGGREIPNNT